MAERTCRPTLDRAGRPRDLHALVNLRILIVDDDADSRNLLGLLVASAGACPMLAADGRAALEMLATSPPHMVLCDILMPEMDGIQVARRIRSNARFGMIPLIAVTGLEGDLDYLRMRDAGFDAHLMKPIDYEMLVSVLSRYAHQAHLPAAA
jgi:CheY-like chemotaxis protein